MWMSHSTTTSDLYDLDGYFGYFRNYIPWKICMLYVYALTSA